jgi:glutathione S-transferase
MLTVHHLNNSRSQRVLWLLEELGVPYEIKRYERDPKTMLAPPELRAIHPLGKSPVITDDGLTIAESGAIIEYLVERYGQGRFAPAAGTPERLRYTYWLHYAEGSVMPPLLLKLVALRIGSAPMPFFAKPIARKIASTLQSSFVDPQIKLHLGYINDAHRLVRRQRIQRSGRADEFPARSRHGAWRTRRQYRSHQRLSRAHPRTPRVSTCAGTRRQV